MVQRDAEDKCSRGSFSQKNQDRRNPCWKPGPDKYE